MKIEAGSKIGDYVVVSQLGAGGMGRVYKVRNELSDRLEAMKVLLPDLESQADLANRFLREIKVQAGLDHPNIAKLYTALRVENQLVMLMELVEGTTLDERLKQGPLAIGEAVNYMSQVLSALDYAHQRGVVHRDIKPANMMLMPDGKIKLLDFGIAKATADQRLTMTGTTLGSLYYMSPEQIQGSQVDARSDLYSAGASLYEMVTGKRPFDGDSQFAVMSAHLARMPVPPIEVNASLPPMLSEIILMSLSKEPGSRFQSAAALLNALRNVQPEAVPAAGTAAAPGPAAPAAQPAVRPATAPTVTVAASGALGQSVPSVTAARAAQGQAVPPPPAAQPEFHLIEPTEVAAKKAGPRRLMWVAVGSLCAVGAIVAFLQFGPYRRTSAKETAPPPANATAPAPQQTLPPPAATPPPETPAAAKPATLPPMEKPPAATGTKKQASQRAQVEAPPPQQPPPPPPPRRSPGEGLPVRSGPGAEPPSQPPVEQPPQRTVDSQLTGLANRNRVEIQGLTERLELLYARANAVRGQLEALQREMAAQGHGLRPDWVQAYELMKTNLDKAQKAINDGDPAATRDAMLKAERNLEILEKGLGR